mgnify:CR=1 FL=1
MMKQQQYINITTELHLPLCVCADHLCRGSSPSSGLPMAKEAKGSTDESAEVDEAEASFGFNDPRYADLQLRLIVSSSSLPLPPPAPVGTNGTATHAQRDNDSSASTTARISESGGNHALCKRSSSLELHNFSLLILL